MATRRILLLPAHRLWPAWNGTVPPADEDRELSYRILARRGIAWRRVDLTPWPWNPFAQTLLRAMDPVRALRVLLFERRADVVFCFFESAALLLLLLRRVLRFRGKVVIVDVGAPGWSMRDRIMALALPRADAVLPYSARQATLLRQDWPGIPIVEPIRANVDCLLYAAASDHPRGPVLAVGDDTSRDYPTFLAAIQGIRHPVVIRSRLLPPQPGLTILSEPLSVPAYRDLIAAAAIVVLPLHPSNNAGGVSVLVQAMASGKPIILSASPGVAEYVTDGVDALVVPCGDAAALRQAMDRLLADPALRRRLGAAARARAEREFSFEAWAAHLESVVQRLIGSAAEPGQ